jgi:two-component system nitrogen regulation sensor histidine kinase NtrY
MVALEQGLTPWFSGNLKVLVENAGGIARQFSSSLCQNVVREMRLMAVDVERAYSSGVYTADRKVFREFMTSRAVFLGLPYAAIIRSDGTVIEKADVGSTLGPVSRPSAEDFTLAATDEPPASCPPGAGLADEAARLSREPIWSSAAPSTAGHRISADRPGRRRTISDARGPARGDAARHRHRVRAW